MASVLEQVAEAADATVAEQRQVARQARSLDRQRRRGVPCSRLLGGPSAIGILELLSVGAHRLTATTGVLRSAIVEALAAEGVSMRQAAKRLGISHQRISALRRRRG